MDVFYPNSTTPSPLTISAQTITTTTSPDPTDLAQLLNNYSPDVPPLSQSPQRTLIQNSPFSSQFNPSQVSPVKVNASQVSASRVSPSQTSPNTPSVAPHIPPQLSHRFTAVTVPAAKLREIPPPPSLNTAAAATDHSNISSTQQSKIDGKGEVKQRKFKLQQGTLKQTHKQDQVQQPDTAKNVPIVNRNPVISLSDTIGPIALPKYKTEPKKTNSAESIGAAHEKGFNSEKKGNRVMRSTRLGTGAAGQVCVDSETTPRDSFDESTVPVLSVEAKRHRFMTDGQGEPIRSLSQATAGRDVSRFHYLPTKQETKEKETPPSRSEHSKTPTHPAAGLTLSGPKTTEDALTERRPALSEASAEDKALEEKNLIEVMTRGQELLQEIQNIRHQCILSDHYPSSDLTDCFPERSEITKKVSAVLSCSHSTDRKQEEKPLKGQRESEASSHKCIFGKGETKKEKPLKKKKAAEKEADLEWMMKVMHSSCLNGYLFISSGRGNVASERQTQLNSTGLAPPKPEEPVLGFCNSGGFTLVESEVEEREVEERESCVLQEPVASFHEEVKRDYQIESVAQTSNGPDHPCLTIENLPSINIEPVVARPTRTPFNSQDVHTAKVDEALSSHSSSPKSSITSQRLPSPPKEQPFCFSHSPRENVPSHEVQEKIQSHTKEQTQRWVHNELLVQLLASLGTSNNEKPTSLSVSQSSLTTPTDDVTDIVKEVLLDELHRLLQKPNEAKNESEVDYTFSSFESDISAATPISTPCPTPPRSPSSPKQTTPAEHTPQVTPTSSLLVLPEVKIYETPEDSPTSLSSTEIEKTSHPLTSLTEDIDSHNAPLNTPLATPTLHLSLVTDETPDKPHVNEEERHEFSLSATDSTDTSSITPSTAAQHHLLSTSETSTDRDVSVGECIVKTNNRLLGPVSVRPDVSLSEGEVPVSPGDAHWKALHTKPVTSDLQNSFTESTSFSHQQESSAIKFPSHHGNGGYSIAAQQDDDDKSDDTLAHVPSLTDTFSSRERDQDGLVTTHRPISPGEVIRPLIEAISHGDNLSLSEGEAPHNIRHSNRHGNKMGRSLSVKNATRDGIDVINISHRRGVASDDHTHSATNNDVEVIRVKSRTCGGEFSQSSSSSNVTPTQSPRPQSLRISETEVSRLPWQTQGASTSRDGAGNLLQGPVKIIDDNEDNNISLDSFTLSSS